VPKKELGRKAQDVFLLPQKQTCFTPDGCKEKEIQNKSSYAQLDFFLTLIYRNAKEIQQDPCVNKLW
jgi:hypothetical protein